MFKIVKKQPLNPTVTKMVVEAPLIAKKAHAGQFIILRASEDGERIPLTIAGYDREAGTVDIIFQIVGGTTMELKRVGLRHRASGCAGIPRGGRGGACVRRLPLQGSRDSRGRIQSLFR